MPEAMSSKVEASVADLGMDASRNKRKRVSSMPTCRDQDAAQDAPETVP